MNPPLAATLAAHLFTSSGLLPETVRHAGIRPADDGSGYVFPYFDWKGGPVVPLFSRTRLVNPKTSQKYTQIGGSMPHLYIPPPGVYPAHLQPDWKNRQRPLIITEGEKKALAAAQHGFLTVAVGGVDSWSKRKIVAIGDNPGSTNRTHRITLDDANAVADAGPEVAVLLDAIPGGWTDRKVSLIFDHDLDPVVKANVQRAAVRLGDWLETQGAHVVQVFLPAGKEKVGLDDFLLANGPEALEALLALEWDFPVHPNLRAFIRDLLGGKKNKYRARRDEVRLVARLALADMRRAGTWYRTPDLVYLHDDRVLRLPDDLKTEKIRNTDFARFIQQRYGVDSADNEAVTRIVNAIAAQDPRPPEVPEQVTVAVVPTPWQPGREDALAFQISATRFLRVRAEGIDIVANGTDQMIFTEPPLVDLQVTQADLDRMPWDQRPDNWWTVILEKAHLVPVPGLSIERTRELLSILCYTNPWLYRWHGAQFPLEFFVGEPGSGKTMLFNLRRGILTGSPSLEGAPSDIRDWYASITHARGRMWIGDNINDMDWELRNRISDDMARFVTDPVPSIQLRELFTTRDLARVPVQSSFGGTSIRTPIWKVDVLQRAAVFHLTAIPPEDRDGGWYEKILHNRTEAVLNHLHVVQAIFREAKRHPLRDQGKASESRLAHFEWVFSLAAFALGIDQPKKLLAALAESTKLEMVESDQVLQAIVAVVRPAPIASRFTAEAIARAAVEYAPAKLVTTPAITRYLQSYRTTVEDAAVVDITIENGQVIVTRRVPLTGAPK